jgi:hypothetical protein
MATDTYTREELIFHLVTGHAHMSFEDAVKDFPAEHFNTTFINGDYTFWDLLEHIRRTQHDILDFMVNPTYKEPKWPNDYWPPKAEKATKKEWDKTVSSYLKDREQLKKLLADKETDLYKKLPQGTGQTVMREIMVIIDHHSYHIGEFAIMRQVHNAWNK